VGRIQVLPAALASQIAAGEVVERPASAVKELIENALDAEATRCDVVCDGGGIGLLSVGDDGIGMHEDDARMSVERHATSKLRKISDLNQMATFGFRGEALPSIASVSRFTLRTRARDSEIGLRLEVEAGGPPKVIYEGMKIGTTIEIRDLFYNVPARRKFLRSTGTESAHVTSAVEGAALSRPDVTFTLTRDGRRVREILRTSSRRERVLAMLPEEALTEIRGERGPLHLEAHLSRPERARPGAAGLSLVVNGRIVKDRMIAATLAQAYGASLPPGNYPRGVVYIDLAPELVDVNVHPQKTEVRFVDARALSDAVYSIVSRDLSVAFSLPQGTRGNRSRAAQKPNPGMGLLPVERPWIPALDRKSTETFRDTVVPGERLTVAERLPTRPSAVHRDEALTPRGELSNREELPTQTPNRGPLPTLVSDGDEDPTDEAEVLPKGADTLVAPPFDANAAVTCDATLSSLSSQDDDADEPAPETMQTPSGEVRAGTVFGSQEREVDSESTSQVNSSAPKSCGRLRFIAQVKSNYLICEGADGLYVIEQHAAAERVTFANLLAQYHAHAIEAQTLLFPMMLDLSPKETELLDEQRELFQTLGLDVRVRSRERVSIHSVPRLLQNANPERLVRELLHEMTKGNRSALKGNIESIIELLARHGAHHVGETLTAVQAQTLLTNLDEVGLTQTGAHSKPVVAVMRYADLERQVGRR
jgi:DNA mismatch repair protein MutL